MHHLRYVQENEDAEGDAAYQIARWKESHKEIGHLKYL